MLSTRNHFVKEEPLGEQLKEPWFNTKYRRYNKPANPRDSFTEDEWNQFIKCLKEPRKNAYVPEKVSTIVSAKDRKARNSPPILISLDKDEKFSLYYLLDHVYLKPLTCIEISLRIMQPSEKENALGKP